MGWLSSQIPGGGRSPVQINSPSGTPVEASSSLLAFGWAQGVAVPGPGSSLAAVAQASALAKLTEAPEAVPATFARGRAPLSDLSSEDSTSALPDLPTVVSLCAGRPH